MIPLIKCRNLTTGEVCTIPSETGFSDSVFDFMHDCLSKEVGLFRHDNLDYYVYETDSFKYCALLNEITSNEKGKKSVIRYTNTDVELFCASIERFAEENFNEIISYAHDIQYMIGSFVHKSIVNKKNTDDIDKLRNALKDINSLSAIISAKDCFFRWRTGTFSERNYSIDVKGKFYKILKAFEFSIQV